MTITFERPIGASSDVAEIEYVAALHQTCGPELRRDGSIYGKHSYYIDFGVFR
jgi:hypothetical protein